MDFELKHMNEPATKVKDDGSAVINVGFTTGPVGCPDSYRMIVGDVIDVNILDFNNKTGEQLNAEVYTAVNEFIATKYPST